MRHTWGNDRCSKCLLERRRYAWGWLFSRNGETVQGEQAPDRVLPDGRSVAVFRVPQCKGVPHANR